MTKSEPTPEERAESIGWSVEDQRLGRIHIATDVIRAAVRAERKRCANVIRLLGLKELREHNSCASTVDESQRHLARHTMLMEAEAAIRANPSSEGESDD